MKKAVLFINVGTPESPAKRSVARYLFEFLTDKRVITLAWPLRYLLVAAVILPMRVASSSKKYRSIWSDKGSPLKAHSSNFMEKIRTKLAPVQIEPFFAMRYGMPSIKEVLASIFRSSPDALLIFPLYPQYASATTGSAIEAAFTAMQSWPFFPKISVLSSFYDAPWFISLWTKRLKPWVESDRHILFCFHGLPLQQVIDSNPRGACMREGCCSSQRMQKCCYVAQCRYIAEHAAAELGLAPDRWTLAFQSRLGKSDWTKPYLLETLQTLAERGIKNVVALSPSFVADCVETDEELNIEAKAFFQRHGGQLFDLIPSLNDSDDWVAAAAEYITKQLDLIQ